MGAFNMFCPECGSKNSENAKFCKECGEDFTPINFSKTVTGICPYCAEKINPNAVKCKYCGEWLNEKAKRENKEEDHTLAIVLGYIFTVLGGVIGLIIGIYLIAQKDKRARNHGDLMIIVNVVWIFILIILISSWMSSVNSYNYYYG
jgi:uncharacterized membrane protein YvbJ